MVLPPAVILLPACAVHQRHMTVGILQWFRKVMRPSLDRQSNDDRVLAFRLSQCNATFGKDDSGPGAGCENRFQDGKNSCKGCRARMILSSGAEDMSFPFITIWQSETTDGRAKPRMKNEVIPRMAERTHG